MFRVLLRELVLTVLALVVASVAAFVLLESLFSPDWTDATRHARTLPISAEHLRGGDLPLLYHRRPRDAAQRTHDDLAALRRRPTDTAALARLRHRQTAALPTLLARLAHEPPAVQTTLFALLSGWSATLAHAELPPADGAAALSWWAHFAEARGLDFRPTYAERQAERLALSDSPNARERLARLGTYALPALVQALVYAHDTTGACRLLAALTTARPGVRAMPRCDDAVAVHEAVSAWRAWWSAEHLEFETLAPWAMTLGTVFETRYGRWLGRALGGQYGMSRTTGVYVSEEVRARLPASGLASGLGGLLGTAVVLGFGGNAALRRRSTGARTADFVGALIPGLGAFLAAWLSLLRVCAGAGGSSALARVFLGGWGWVRVLAATVAVGALASLWLSRRKGSAALNVVRLEAERWIVHNRTPSVRQRLLHGLRMGVASVLAPLGFAAPTVLLGSLVVEWAVGVRGMGDLTLRALVAGDGPWLLVSLLTIVPLLLGRRWAARSMFWMLGARADGSLPRSATLPPPPPLPTGVEGA